GNAGAAHDFPAGLHRFNEARIRRASPCDIVEIRHGVYQVTVLPGRRSQTLTSFASSCNWLGRPVSGGNVPKCIGITVGAFNKRHATAASRGLIVYKSPIGRNASSGL